MNQENNPLHNFVYSDEMVAFVKSANDLCQFLEDVKGTDAKVFISKSVQLLSGIYSTVVQVGETEPLFETSLEATITEQEWAQIYQQISLILGAQNDFIRPAEENEYDRSELVTHTISEDMADIYQDLRDFTTIYSRGLEELMNDAAWEVQERFVEHWGKKLLRTLTVLHELFVNGIDPESENDSFRSNSSELADPMEGE